jgi:hypothetical protein
VHCDVCHHIESLREGGEPGVAEWLHIVRPSEPSSNAVFGEFAPLTFGPYLDVLNPNMGSAYRTLFHEPALCGGCHQDEQPVLVPGAEIDLGRWPLGKLPVHTTYGEWSAGPMNPGAPCQSCHMPPDAEAGNSVDLYSELDVDPGVAAGWAREPGSVRMHAWYGPRQPASGMLQLAATIDVDSEVTDGELIARVTVRNVGPGHAIPTGEPLRNLVLSVDAECDGTALSPSGGDATPAFGGYEAMRSTPEDLGVWPEAEEGMVVRLARNTGWIDYEGYGSFGDGSFDATDKGLPNLQFVAELSVASVAADGTVTFAGDDATADEALAQADTAFLAWPDSGVVDGGASAARAGAPGFAFARVMVGADGEQMVPHWQAVDVASDNRILPTESWTSEHHFAATCAAPVVHAVLVHRAYPYTQAERFNWTLTDSVMDETWR